MATEMQLFTVAGLLRRGKALDGLSSALTLLGLAIGLAPLLGAVAQPLGALFCALLVLLGLLEKYWALRVALDAELFQRLANDAERLPLRTLDLDQALVRLGLQPANKAARSWDERSCACRHSRCSRSCCWPWRSCSACLGFQSLDKESSCSLP